VDEGNAGKFADLYVSHERYSDRSLKQKVGISSKRDLVPKKPKNVHHRNQKTLQMEAEESLSQYAHTPSFAELAANVTKILCVIKKNTMCRYSAWMYIICTLVCERRSESMAV
jgi:hypothetical protein